MLVRREVRTGRREVGVDGVSRPRKIPYLQVREPILKVLIASRSEPASELNLPNIHLFIYLIAGVFRGPIFSRIS